MAELSKTYDPKSVESDIYQRWEASGYFNPDNLPDAKKRKPFSIAMPPPNITGDLHFGHALGMTIQDVFTRYHRMRGEAALWLPGTDHAAIGTEILVKQDLQKQGIDPHQLSREKFLEYVWAWKEKYGGRIVEQTKRIGASADWSRLRFTMDAGLSKAVQTAFIRLYEDGLIYRGERIVNWCPTCGTAVSDLEVDHQQVPGKLWQIRYPQVDGSGSITVATTRPETLLGDTAVAVHPEDQRYTKMVGKKLRLPIVGREIPVIADPRIDRSFGTGAVKVTPAHDPLDFDLGNDHQLSRIAVIGSDGKMTADAGDQFAGLSVEAARKKVLATLETSGALTGAEDYIHAVGFCVRSNSPIEPLVSRQWFVKTQPLAKRAISAVRSGKIEVVPARFKKVYFHWMENIRDWNISRQIWWGHRLPVWYQQSDEHRDDPKVSLTKPGDGWVQDPDTLDTWFSSGLWTFSTLGWPASAKATAGGPAQKSDLERFHPTSVLVTGWDILFFWVARMIMLSLYFMKEVPFKTVYLHGLVLDVEGKKMSKSKGTGLDPIPVMEKYGTDAFRLSLIIGNAPGQDFRLYEKKIEGYRNFANKLWNVSRFILSKPRPVEKAVATSFADKWIVSRAQQVIAETTSAIDSFDLSRAGQVLYEFVWNDFADWYIELSKLYPNPAVQYETLETVLKLLHPLMPFVTEEIWSKIYPDAMLMVTAWPKAKKISGGAKAEKQFTAFQQTVVALRNFKIHSGLITGAPGKYRDPNEQKIDAASLRALTKIQVELENRLVPTGGYKEVYLGPTQFQFQAEYVDQYQSWVTQEREEIQRFVKHIEAKLANQDFVARAKPEIVERERQKLAEAKQRLLGL